MEKIDARKPSTEAQQQLRNQAIRPKKTGRTYKEIAEITGRTVGNVGKLLHHAVKKLSLRMQALAEPVA